MRYQGEGTLIPQPKNTGALEIIAHVLEDRGNLRAEQDKSANHDDCYQGDDQGIFDQPLALVAM